MQKTIKDHTGTALAIAVTEGLSNHIQVIVDQQRNRGDLPEYYRDAYGSGETVADAVSSFRRDLVRRACR